MANFNFSFEVEIDHFCWINSMQLPESPERKYSFLLLVARIFCRLKHKPLVLNNKFCQKRRRLLALTWTIQNDDVLNNTMTITLLLWKMALIYLVFWLKHITHLGHHYKWIWNSGSSPKVRRGSNFIINTKKVQILYMYYHCNYLDNITHLQS